MPATPTCLEALVGLAPEAISACFPLPDGDTAYITSSSRAGSAGGGVYLSQLAGLNFEPSKNAATDLYDKLVAARRQAAQYVRQSLTTATAYPGKQALFTAAGTLGKAGNGSVYQGAAALTLTLGYQPGGAYEVTALGLQTTVAVPEVAIQLDGVTVATINTGPTASAQPIPPFLLPFDGAIHQLVPVGLPDGVRPLTGQLFCTTGCNSSAPGTIGGSVARYLPEVTSTTNNAGFLLGVREVCTAGADMLCYAATASDALADVLAQAVVGAAAYFYLLGLVQVGEYSRYTLANPQIMEGQAQEYKQAADRNIAWLAQPGGLGRLDNPCFVCAANPSLPRVVAGRG